MTNVGNYKSVAPVTDAIETDEKRVHYWTKPLVPLINFTLFNHLYQSVGKISKIDLVIGGDHSQERFRMLGKIVRSGEDNSIIDTAIMRIAHIDC